MTRVQLLIPDEDLARFVHQTRREGVSLSAWLRAAALERLDRESQARRFASGADLDSFFADCDALEGPDTEPDWEQHRLVIEHSRGRGGAGRIRDVRRREETDGI